MLEFPGQESNGEGRELPTIAVGWDAEGQQVLLQFDAAQFRQWPFVVMVLEMAVKKAEELQRMAAVKALQDRAAEEKQAQALRRNLGL